ncbi:PAS domain-containing protein [Pseudomonas asiatica]|uniref:PAS domain-containing protein n=1 Tax=Pseudomonas asiatica TaxID=2219225 RepID=UPI003D1890C4
MITTTDTHGTITYCNDAFVSISGFERNQLLGPRTISCAIRICQKRYSRTCGVTKVGKAWMGIVKNRCQNGDFYWVNAYVVGAD